MNIRTQYYNTAPRGVQPRNRQVVEDEIARKGEKVVRREDEPLPQKVRWELAGNILDTYM
ncbi:hypothetical protein J4443_01815 [Candidatus Woesearchaeota archaeon]|nr:hypothetical protein [Candidatus Woesearchaeota archaeon]